MLFPTPDSRLPTPGRSLSRSLTAVVLSAVLTCPRSLSAQAGEELRVTRPFGTLREQAEVQQRWLARRMETVLPALMRQYGVDMWVIPMREYNEDPVFSSLVSPETFAARRRTIYMFFDKCAGARADSAASAPGRARRADGSPAGAGGAAAGGACIAKIALGGSSQGGVYEAVRSTKAVAAPAAGSRSQDRTAELWGDQQWQVLKDVVAKRNPKVIAIDVSRTFAFADGLSAGEYEGMREALGPEWTRRFKPAEGLAVDLIATRLPDEEVAYRKMTELVWDIIGTAFSNRVITPGVTRTDDVVWWMRQRVNDLGLGSWFQPSVEVQRKGVTAEQLGENPVIQKGDVLHCDFGLVAMRLNTDTQHMGYVLKDGETDVPAGLRKALANSNRLQDIVMGEIRPGRTGNEILNASRVMMKLAGIDGTVYSHPVGMHGHGAGPLIGLWDYQEGCRDAATTRSSPACGSRSSSRPPPRCRSGAGSESGRRKRRT